MNKINLTKSIEVNEAFKCYVLSLNSIFRELYMAQKDEKKENKAEIKIDVLGWLGLTYCHLEKFAEIDEEAKELREYIKSINCSLSGISAEEFDQHEESIKYNENENESD